MAAGLLVASVGIQAVSSIMSSEKQAEAARAEAANKELQASEVESRGQANVDLLQKGGQKVIGEQISQFAANGVELSGSALDTLEDTHRKINEDVYNAWHESRFKADQLRRGADVSTELASDRELEGYIGAAGSILGGAAKAYSLNDSNTFSGGIKSISVFPDRDPRGIA